MSTSQAGTAKITIHKRQIQHPCFDQKLGDALVLRMMQIPGGTFMMGSPNTELERFDREGPQHEVTVPAFFMGKYPITQAQWRFIAGLEKIGRELDLNPSRFEGDNRPVEQVSWHDAVEFCDRLSRYTQHEYRLPSEAEWEYACRAGTQTPFHFGETITTELANYDGANEKYGAYGPGPRGENRRETTPVDHFGVANAWGLCDMHGNVLEWCLDHWHNSYEGAPKDARAWLTDNELSVRVVRGGSWDYSPRNCRSAYRNYYNPDYRDDFVGFRVVCRAPRFLQVKKS